MKTLIKIFVILFVAMYITSCAVYSCPTYSKVDKKENKI